MALDLPWPVLSATPKALSISGSFMCGFVLRSSRKLTQPIVRMIPQAQVSGLPPSRGDGRLRASFSASPRQRTAYSSLRCSRQNWSVIATMRWRTAPASPDDLLVELRLAISLRVLLMIRVDARHSEGAREQERDRECPDVRRESPTHANSTTSRP